jgi:TatA/E family protein of Tat protein translocase
MPFNIGPGELIIVLIIALLVVGPGKLPDVGSALGKSIREFRKAATDVKDSTSLEPAQATAAPAAAAAAPVVAAVTAPPAPVIAPPAPPAVPEPVAAAVAASPEPDAAAANEASAPAAEARTPDA